LKDWHTAKNLISPQNGGILRLIIINFFLSRLGAQYIALPQSFSLEGRRKVYKAYYQKYRANYKVDAIPLEPIIHLSFLKRDYIFFKNRNLNENRNYKLFDY